MYRARLLALIASVADTLGLKEYYCKLKKDFRAEVAEEGFLYSILEMSSAPQIGFKALVLFLSGVFFSLLFNLLQTQHRVTQFPPNVIFFLSSAWWVPPCCGISAVLVGFTYPFCDSYLGVPHRYKREWSSVMRCVGVFIGINYASAKLPFVTNVQLSLTLAVMAVGLWWLFDRSFTGFTLAVGISVLGTGILQVLAYNDVLRFTQADFFLIRSWIPCVFFSGGICFGNLGRQLSLQDKKQAHGGRRGGKLKTK
eukprot:Nk52_evm2s1705 gene=Nk52_evmTU2s1705